MFIDTFRTVSVVGALCEGNEIAIRIENAKLSRTPRFRLQPGIRVHDALAIAIGEELLHAGDVDATRGVLRDVAIRAGPEVKLHRVTRHNALHTTLGIYPRKAEAVTIEREAALDVE